MRLRGNFRRLGMKRWEGFKHTVSTPRVIGLSTEIIILFEMKTVIVIDNIFISVYRNTGHRYIPCVCVLVAVFVCVLLCVRAFVCVCVHVFLCTCVRMCSCRPCVLVCVLGWSCSCVRVPLCVHVTYPPS